MEVSWRCHGGAIMVSWRCHGAHVCVMDVHLCTGAQKGLRIGLNMGLNQGVFVHRCTEGSKGCQEGGVIWEVMRVSCCLLYTSDAADE